jgi:hypothetical protein
MPRKLEVGATLSRVFELYGQQAGVLLPAAAVIFLIPAVAALLVGGAVGLAFIVSLVGIVAGFWYQGVVVAAVQDMEDGRRDFSVGELFRSVGPYLGTLVGAGILAGLGILLGLVLLIVPGLVLLTWWALIAPVVVLERAGVTQALGRSRELVRGNGWQVFGIIVLLTIIQAIGSGILRAIAIGISDTRLADAIGSYVGNVLVAPLTGIAATVVYLRLREAKVWEGSGSTPTDFAPPVAPTAGGRPEDPARPAGPDEPPTGGVPLPGGSPAATSPAPPAGEEAWPSASDQGGTPPADEQAGPPPASGAAASDRGAPSASEQAWTPPPEHEPAISPPPESGPGREEEQRAAQSRREAAAAFGEPEEQASPFAEPAPPRGDEPPEERRGSIPPPGRE